MKRRLARAANHVVGWLVNKKPPVQMTQPFEHAFRTCTRNSKLFTSRVRNLFSGPGGRSSGCGRAPRSKTSRTPFLNHKKALLAFASAPFWLKGDSVVPKDAEAGSSSIPPALHPSEIILNGQLRLQLGLFGIFGVSDPRNYSTAGAKRKIFQDMNVFLNLGEQQEPASTTPACNSRPASPKHKAPPASSSEPSEKTPPHAKIFQRLVHNDSLVLREGDITPDQWEALSSFLASCPHIKTLRIHGVDITAREADTLGAGLKQIRSITFCDNSIGLNDGTLEKLVAVLLCCGLLESTNIIRNSISDAHIPKLVELMKQHSTLERVSLCWNGITDKGASCLAGSLSLLSYSMRYIDLSYNLIDQQGCSRLEEAARQRALLFPGLHTLPDRLLRLHLAHNQPIHKEIDSFSARRLFPRHHTQAFPLHFGRGWKENIAPSFHHHHPVVCCT